MEDNARQDIKISGAGSVSGGLCKDVSISGSGSVGGDIDCINFQVSGASKVNGNLKAQSVRISGSTRVKGNVESDELKVSGALQVETNILVKELKISGAADIDGNLTADQARISGGLKVKGDVNAETFKSSGAFKIGGLLNAGVIDIALYGESRVSEIGGEQIVVRKEGSGKMIFKFLQSILTHSPDLTVETIEGDDIYLEYTKAKTVRGNNVRIGPGCAIELVEYKTSFELDNGSSVAENRKIES